MSEPDLHLPRLDGEVEAMLRCERERPSVTKAQAERMWKAISAELAMAAAPSPMQSASLAKPAFPRAAGSTIGKLALARALPWIAVSIGVGSVAGFAAGHRLARSTVVSAAPVSHVREERLDPTPAPAPPAQSFSGTSTVQWAPGTSAVQAPLVLPPAAASAKPKHRRVVAASDALAGEEATVRAGEAALRAGDWAAALREADSYAQRYPQGELAEEAAYLGVRALVLKRDYAAAQASLLEFRRRFPLSPLGKSSGD